MPPQEAAAALEALRRQEKRATAAVAATRMEVRNRPGFLPENLDPTGNLTWGFFNFGEQGKDSRELQLFLAKLLRQSPAMLLGGCEVKQEFADLLAEPGVSAVAGARRQWEYTVCLSSTATDKKPCMVALRSETCESITILHGDPIDHGLYKK